MADQYFRDSAYGRLLLARAGYSRALRVATFGDSHCANYWAPVHAYAAFLSDANINFDYRQVYVENGTNDAQTTLASPTLANRGSMYATGGTTPAHLINTQLPQFVADVAAGRRWDIGVSDGSLYNVPPGNQGDLDATATKLQQVIDTFLDPAGNSGLCFIVQGTHGIDPTLAQGWAAMWQRRADASGGRIRFLDTARLLIDPTTFNAGNPAAPAWVIRGGAATTFGSVQGDPAHVGAFGAYIIAQSLAVIYQELCPKRFPRGGSYGNKPYDPANARWGDVLGPDAGMVGTAGIDLTTSGGTFDTNIAGTGHSSGGAVNNRWELQFTGVAKPTLAITASAGGGKQQSMVLAGNATANAFIELGCQPTLANLNNGVASRRYHLGLDIEYVGVTGAQPPCLVVNNVIATPFHTQAQSDGLPDNFSGTFRMRSLDVLALSGANPKLAVWAPLRQKNGIAGTILVRNAFFRLVEE